MPSPLGAHRVLREEANGHADQSPQSGRTEPVEVVRSVTMQAWDRGKWWHTLKNPSPVSPKGEMPMPLETSINLESQQLRQPRKETDLMPSPFGEGQTDTPINRRNRGEVCYDASVG